MAEEDRERGVPQAYLVYRRMVQISMINEARLFLAILNDRPSEKTNSIIEKSSRLAETYVSDSFIEAYEIVRSGSLFYSEKSLVNDLLTILAKLSKDQLADYLSLKNKISMESTITYWDEAYPKCLSRISKAPPIIFVNGSLPKLPGIAVTGTRNCSLTGSRTAYEIGRLIARKNITLITGLAKGIDAAATIGALDAGGRTVCVLGTHLGKIYPLENRPLATRVIERGALISEITKLAPEHKGVFLRRNRIISGLAGLVIAVESGSTGGTVGQIEVAMSQGRPVTVLDQRTYTDSLFAQGFQKMYAQARSSFSSLDDLEKIIDKYFQRD
jgi:DNA processing protein